MNFLHEDADLLVVDKPAGLNVAADDGLDSVLARIQRKIPDACLVHRIDQDTSGVLLIAKNDATKDLLQAQFKARRVIKEYLAILDGNLPRDYVRKVSYLARNPKNRRQMKSYDYPQPNRKYRLTVSEFFVQHRVHTRLNLVKVNISTGRTHQIRVHAQSLGGTGFGGQTVSPSYHPAACVRPECPEHGGWSGETDASR